MERLKLRNVRLVKDIQYYFNLIEYMFNDYGCHLSVCYDGTFETAVAQLQRV